MRLIVRRPWNRSNSTSLFPCCKRSTTKRHRKPLNAVAIAVPSPASKAAPCDSKHKSTKHNRPRVQFSKNPRGDVREHGVRLTLAVTAPVSFLNMSNRGPWKGFSAAASTRRFSSFSAALRNLRTRTANVCRHNFLAQFMAHRRLLPLHAPCVRINKCKLNGKQWMIPLENGVGSLQNAVDDAQVVGRR